MQLTPTFRIGALQLRPISNIVTMRLPPSQQPQSAVNLRVTWEIAKFQPTPGGFGIVRLTPSQRQRPTNGPPPFFAVADFQLVSNFQAAPVQVIPSQQASVVVTGGFQIANAEFSPSFELTSIVLNSSAKDVAVQLPGAHSVEGAVRFEIVHVQLGSSGEIGMMQLNLLDQRPAQSPEVYNSPRIANAIDGGVGDGLPSGRRGPAPLCNIIKPADGNTSAGSDQRITRVKVPTEFCEREDPGSERLTHRYLDRLNRSAPDNSDLETTRL